MTRSAQSQSSFFSYLDVLSSDSNHRPLMADGSHFHKCANTERIDFGCALVCFQETLPEMFPQKSPSREQVEDRSFSKGHSRARIQRNIGAS
jgi:hypothetical protein